MSAATTDRSTSRTGRRRALITLGALSCAVMGNVVAQTADLDCQVGGRETVPNRLVVRFVPSADAEMALERKVDQSPGFPRDVKIVRVDGNAGIATIEIDDEDPVRFESRARKFAAFIDEVLPVEGIQPEFRWFAPPVVERTAEHQNQLTDWAFNNIRARQARSRHVSSQRMIVAIIDSGVAFTQEDFQLARWINWHEAAGFPTRQPCEDGMSTSFDNRRDDDRNGVIDDVCGANFVTAQRPTGNAVDDHGHGTLVASLIAGAPTSDRFGGVAREVALMPVKVLDRNLAGTTSSLAAGIAYALSHGAELINVSVESRCNDPAVANVIRRAGVRGRMVVVAAGNHPGGNDNDATPIYPAAYRLNHVIAVGGTTDKLARVDNSNWGDHTVHLGAPGIDVCGAWIENHTYCGTGTSFATPLVTGTLAVLAALTPDWRWRQRATYLLDATTVPDRPLRFRSGGVLQAGRATAAPVVIESPEPGVTWVEGTEQTVAWRSVFASAPCSKVDVALLAGDGSTSIPLTNARAYASSGEAKLVVPRPRRAQQAAKIRITCAGTNLRSGQIPIVIVSRTNLP